MFADRVELKQSARSTLIETKPSPILVILAYLALVWILQFAVSMSNGNSPFTTDTVFHYIFRRYDSTKAFIERLMGTYLHHPTQRTHYPLGLFYTVWLICFFIETALDAGLSIYCLKICREAKASFGDLLGGFKIFFRVLWLEICITLLCLLWGVLLIVPGIVASYSYRMALFILLDNPQLSVSECLSRSRRMMTGVKGELFVLDLSFLGWYILEIIPPAAIWVVPYKTVTNTYFYLRLLEAEQSEPEEQTEPRLQPINSSVINMASAVSPLDVIEYKGYTADICVDYSGGRFYGAVRGEPGIKPFSAGSIEGVTEDFYRAVDAFDEKCESGEEVSERSIEDEIAAIHEEYNARYYSKWWFNLLKILSVAGIFLLVPLIKALSAGLPSRAIFIGGGILIILLTVALTEIISTILIEKKEIKAVKKRPRDD